MSNRFSFPQLDLTAWQPTRDTLHSYSQLLGKIRRALTPAHEKWWHISLLPTETGLTTTEIPVSEHDEARFVLSLNLVTHHLVITAPNGDEKKVALQNQSSQHLMDFALSTLAGFGAQPQIDQSLFYGSESRPYTLEHAESYLTALRGIHNVFETFRVSLPGKTSPLQLWPHHFDLSLEWFSGRKAQASPGEEEGDEQIGFGFSTGDEGIPEAYFYANPWPFPAEVVETPLPQGASWYTESWRGSLLRYNTLVESDDSAGRLRAYLNAVYENASSLMK